MASQRAARTLFVSGIALMVTIVVPGNYLLAPILDSLGVRAHET